MLAMTSLAEECCREVSDKSVVEMCCREVSENQVGERAKCCGEVLEKKEYCSEKALERSFVGMCWRRVL